MGGSRRIISQASAGVTLRGLGGGKLKPSASAPKSAAIFASAQFVMPKIFPRTGCVTATSSASRRQQIFQRSTGIGIAHEMFADQKCIEACLAQADQIVRR